MTYKYLTQNYVEWLKLPTFVIQIGSTGCCFVPENAPKPTTTADFRPALKLDGHTYIQRSDRKSWDRLDTWPPRDKP